MELDYVHLAMRPHHLPMVLCYIVLSIHGTEAPCPANCTCTDGDTKVDCTGLGLTDVPELTDSVLELTLASNNIQSLGAAKLSHLSNLESLNLSGNSMSLLSPLALAGLERLQRLDLSHNALTVIDDDTFEMLADLTELHLNNNHLRSVEGLFGHCLKLSSLYLAHNDLAEDTFEELNNIPWVNYVDLSGNPIRNLFYLMLDKMAFLHTLTVKNGDVRYIDPNAFVGLNHLTTLDMSNNQIASVRREMFHVLPMLTHLGLSGNPLVCECATQQLQDWLNDNTVVLLESTTCRDAEGAKQNVAYADLASLCDLQPTQMPDWCHTNVHIELAVTAVAAHNMTCHLRITGIRDFNESDVLFTYRQPAQTYTEVWFSPNVSTFHIYDLEPKTGYIVCAAIPACSLETCVETSTSAVTGASVLPVTSPCCKVGVLVGATSAVFLLIIVFLILLFWLVYTRRCCYTEKQQKGRDQGENVAMHVLPSHESERRRVENDFYESIPGEKTNYSTIRRGENRPVVRTREEPEQQAATNTSTIIPTSQPAAVNTPNQTPPKQSDISGFIPGKAKVFRKIDESQGRAESMGSDRNLPKASVERLRSTSVGDLLRTDQLGDAPDVPCKQGRHHLSPGMPSPERRGRLHGSFPKMGQSAIRAQALPDIPRDDHHAITRQRLPPVPGQENNGAWPRSGMPSLPNIPPEETNNLVSFSPSLSLNDLVSHRHRNASVPDSPHFYNEPDMF